RFARRRSVDWPEAAPDQPRLEDLRLAAKRRAQALQYVLVQIARRHDALATVRTRHVPIGGHAPRVEGRTGRRWPVPACFSPKVGITYDGARRRPSPAVGVVQLQPASD